MPQFAPLENEDKNGGTEQFWQHLEYQLMRKRPISRGKSSLRCFVGSSVVKNLPTNTGDTGSIPGLGRSGRRTWQPPPAFSPGEFCGQRSLAGHSLGHDCACVYLLRGERVEVSPCLCGSLAEVPWPSYWIFLGLSVLLCKMHKVIVRTE